MQEAIQIITFICICSSGRSKMNLFRLCLQLPFENKGPVMKLSSSNCPEGLPPLATRPCRLMKAAFSSRWISGTLTIHISLVLFQILGFNWCVFNQLPRRFWSRAAEENHKQGSAAWGGGWMGLQNPDAFSTKVAWKEELSSASQEGLGPQPLGPQLWTKALNSHPSEIYFKQCKPYCNSW